ncbi:hypothetical protein D3C73_1188420 [compost metagenome]
MLLGEGLDSLPRTGDDRLLLRIEIGREDILPVCRKRLDHIRCGKHCHHAQAVLSFDARLHRLAADIHQLQPFFISERSGNRQRGQLAEAVAQDIARVEPDLLLV